MPDASPMIVARWESKTRKWFVVLESFDGRGYGYTANDSGGVLYADDDADAIAQVQARVDLGLFQPDAAKTPMRRVAPRSPAESQHLTS